MNEYVLTNTGGEVQIAITDALTTLPSQISAKANSSDVLTKTNTSAFTPTANYHPATKKYVDDNISPDNIKLIDLSATTPLLYSNTTGVFSIPAATTSANGYLSSTDWNTFNSKQSALTAGTDYLTASTLATTYLKIDQTTAQTLTASPIFDFGTTGYLPYYSALKKFVNSQIFTDGTSTGIGTATPTSKLHLHRTDSSELLTIESTLVAGYSRIKYVGTNRTFAMGVGNASETAYGVAGKYYLYDNTAAAVRMVVDSSGNFGIGNTAPSEKIDVTGNIKASGTITGTTNIVTPKIGLSASTTTLAPLNIPHGVDMTTPVNGDVWTTTNGLKAYINGAIKTYIDSSYYSLPSQSEAETGTDTTARVWSALRVAQAVAAKAIVKNSASPESIVNIWAGTQVQYNNLGSYSSSTLYFTIE